MGAQREPAPIGRAAGARWPARRSARPSTGVPAGQRTVRRWVRGCRSGAAVLGPAGRPSGAGRRWSADASGDGGHPERGLSEAGAGAGARLDGRHRRGGRRPRADDRRAPHRGHQLAGGAADQPAAAGTDPGVHPSLGPAGPGRARRTARRRAGCRPALRGTDRPGVRAGPDRDVGLDVRGRRGAGGCGRHRRRPVRPARAAVAEPVDELRPAATPAELSRRHAEPRGWPGWPRWASV